MVLEMFVWCIALQVCDSLFRDAFMIFSDPNEKSSICLCKRI